MSDTMPDFQTLGNSLCFPLYIYKENNNESGLFDFEKELVNKTSGINKEFRFELTEKYKNKNISDEDIFYSVYSILNHPDYRSKFSNDLIKSLPRVPIPKNYEVFKLLAHFGKKLGDLHINFEKAKQYPVTIEGIDNVSKNSASAKQYFRVDKMKFAGTRDSLDKTTVIYNNNISIKNIPIEAYDYVVNSRPALEWVMERQCVKVDKDSGIVNDANDYANETMNNPAYPLELFQRVITVSLETIKIVKSLPPLDL